MLRNIRRNMRKAFLFPRYALKAFFMRGKSIASYHLSMGWSTPPETVSLLLTYQCNLRCAMCGQWGKKGSARRFSPEILKRGLDLRTIEKVIDDVASFSPAITLFGGEPLLHRDIIPTLRLIKERNLRANIITNGTLVNNIAKTLVELELDEIIFSLDGPPEIHDKVRGKNGVYEAARDGFLRLYDEKTRVGSKKPVLNVNSTIFDFNYRYLPETLETARSLMAEEVTFHHLIFLSEAMFLNHNRALKKEFNTSSPDWGGFILDSPPNIKIDLLNKMIREVKSQGASVYPNLSEREVHEYYIDFEFSPKNYRLRCKSPWMVAYIFPDGSVHPCLSMGVTMGDINKEPFLKIWNNERYKKYRRVVKKQGHFDACARCTELYRF